MWNSLSSVTSSPRRVAEAPQGVHRRGDDAFGHGVGAWAGVEDHAADEAFAQVVTQHGQAGQILRLDGGGRFDLDAHNPAVRAFEDKVDLDATAVAVVVQGGSLVDPAQLARTMISPFCQHGPAVRTRPGRRGPGMTTPHLADYLSHIIDAISRIDRYTDGLDRPRFATDDRTQDAAIGNLEIIGEASHRI